MYIGIDLGTSGVKVILLDEDQTILATSHRLLSISRPHLLWSEQDPEEWWIATNEAISELALSYNLINVKAIGLAGQMHGAVLLDKYDQILRPAILWNDGRSEKECAELEQAVGNARKITGNIMMAGFTAPKLRWVAKHQPRIFADIAKVLLPKDYLRLKLSGEYATDMSDASGTMWLNVASRQWSSELLTACQLDPRQMPRLFEGNEITGYLRVSLAKKWGMCSVPIVAGGGDNAAGAVGVGLYKAGQSMLSLGTSGVYFVVTEKCVSNPENAVHSFCHALPARWHLMSVILSATSAIDWACNTLGFISVSQFFSAVEQESQSSDVLFLPYLSGERTPHNDPNAKGVFWGLTHKDNRVSMARAVIEGVSFALAEGIKAIDESGGKSETITLIGGGSKSEYWRQLLADISGKNIEFRKGGDVGPALGAAKLAQLAVNRKTKIENICQPLLLERCYQPNLSCYQYYVEKRERFALLYQRLKGV